MISFRQRNRTLTFNPLIRFTSFSFHFFPVFTCCSITHQVWSSLSLLYIWFLHCLCFSSSSAQYFSSARLSRRCYGRSHKKKGPAVQIDITGSVFFASQSFFSVTSWDFKEVNWGRGLERSPSLSVEGTHGLDRNFFVTLQEEWLIGDHSFDRKLEDALEEVQKRRLQSWVFFEDLGVSQVFENCFFLSSGMAVLQSLYRVKARSRKRKIDWLIGQTK